MLPAEPRSIVCRPTIPAKPVPTPCLDADPDLFLFPVLELLRTVCDVGFGFVRQGSLMIGMPYRGRGDNVLTRWKTPRESAGACRFTTPSTISEQAPMARNSFVRGLAGAPIDNGKKADRR
jgi:hypothetical protein